MRHIATNMVIDMVTERLEIELADNSFTKDNQFNIFLKPSSSDVTNDCLDPETFALVTRIDFELNERPKKIKPFNIVRHRIHNIKFENLDQVVVIRSSPRNRDKAVRFSNPISSDDDCTSCTTSEASSIASDLASESTDTADSSVDELTLFMPECSLSESDLCALDLDVRVVAPDSETAAVASARSDSSTSWKRQLFLNTVPVSPPLSR
eukprot:gene22162-28269_t